MHPGDWPAVRAIYEAGIATGHATFETTAPTWERWDKSHLEEHRLVATVGGAVAGWALTNMLVKVLTGVFDPPPAQLAVPWAYLLSVLLIAGAAMAAAAWLATRMARQPAVEQLREL